MHVLDDSSETIVYVIEFFKFGISTAFVDQRTEGSQFKLSKNAATTIGRWKRSLPCRLLFSIKIEVIVFILLHVLFGEIQPSLKTCFFCLFFLY